MLVAKSMFYKYSKISLPQEWKTDITLPSVINCKENMVQSTTLWFSAGGTKSVLHQDDADNLLMMLEGEKDVVLIHQDEWPRLYANVSKVGGVLYRYFVRNNS